MKFAKGCKHIEGKHGFGLAKIFMTFFPFGKFVSFVMLKSRFIL